MNRDDLRKVAAELNIKGRSKMDKDTLQDAIFEHPNNPLTVNRSGDVVDPRETVVVDDLSGKQEAILETFLEEATDVVPSGDEGLKVTRADIHAEIDRQVKSGQLAMPYGYRGRGIGAKTYLTVSDHTLNREIKRQNRLRVIGMGMGAIHLPNSERATNYETQNYAIKNGTFSYGPRTDAPSRPGYRAKLTPKQMRRLRKKGNKHGEELAVRPARERRPHGHSVLARTPHGDNILFPFGA